MDRVNDSLQFDALIWRANHDEQTELYNHFYLKDMADRYLSETEAAGAVLVYFDISNLRRVNIFYGEAMGDWLVYVLADRLKSIQSERTICARVRSKSFAILLLGADEAALDSVQELLALMKEPVRIEEEGIFPMLDCGIAFAPKDALTGNGLMRCAELALNASKQLGNHKLMPFAQEMEEDALRRALLIQDLGHAVKNESFLLVYQPQMSAVTGEAIAAEALIRWQHPTQGMVSPAEFIQLAEQSGNMIKMGQWIMKQACRDAAAWVKPLQVSVNVSAAQLLREEFYLEVVRTLEESCLPPSRLRLEITESAITHIDSRIQNILAKLRYHGVTLSLDDFGTGMASLAHLNSFSLDEIKLDQYFIHKIGTDLGAEAIIRMIINLARDLGMKTMAEGVENADQVVFLQSQGCDRLQGYFYGQPMTNEAWMQRMME